MKKMITILIVLVCASVCMATEPNEPSEALTLWVFGQPNLDSQNNQIGTWLGLRKGDSEFGAAFGWKMYTKADTPDDTQSRFALGVYGLYHLPDVLQTVQNVFYPMEWLPESITAKPAVGLEILADVEGKGVSISPVVVLSVYEIFAIEYKYSAYSDDTTALDNSKIGISLKFEF